MAGEELSIESKQKVFQTFCSGTFYIYRQFEASVAVLEAEEQLQLQLNNPGLTSSLQVLDHREGAVLKCTLCLEWSLTLNCAQETHDHNIPFPRSSGARFCGDGHLVTFGWTRQYSVPVARWCMDDVSLSLF